MSDAHRFPLDAAKRVGQDIGVYGGGVTPGVSLKSQTGVARGEELFHRPELVRPWRSSSVQRHAETVVGKEQEIEVLTRKCTELRSQLSAASRELQRAFTTHKTDFDRQKVENDQEKAKMQGEIDLLKRRLSDVQRESDHRNSLLKAQHESEVAILTKKLKISSDIANEMNASFLKQMDEVKSSAAREVDLVQKLCHARTSELSNEIQVANDSTKRLSDRSASIASELQSELQRSESKMLSQLKQQEERFNIQRQAMLAEKAEAEHQRDRAVADYITLQEKMRSMSHDLEETESRFLSWNEKIHGDLEPLCTFFSSLIRDVEGCEVIPPPSGIRAVDAYVPPRQINKQEFRSSIERISEKLQNLLWLKKRNADAVTVLMQRIKSLESGDGKTTKDVERRDLERSLQLNALASEMQDVKSHQLRLQSAMAEVRDTFEDIESHLSASKCRLEFFSRDLRSAVSCKTNCVVAPKGIVSFVALAVEGSQVLWETKGSLYTDALVTLNSALRAKLLQYGGYECVVRDDSSLFAFCDPVAALRFATESQEWLLNVTWPEGLSDSYHAETEYGSDGKLLFNGLRLSCGLHIGEVISAPNVMPTAQGGPRIQYFGKTVTEVLHVVSAAQGGQILSSAAFWHAVSQASAPDLGISVHNVKTDESTLCMISPASLSGRVFHKHSDEVPPTSTSISPAFTNIRCVAVEEEVVYLKGKHEELERSMIALQNEEKNISKLLESLFSAIKEQRTKNKDSTDMDVLIHAAAMDRLSTRCELSRDETKRVSAAQSELSQWVRNMEDAMCNFTKSALAEDDIKRKFMALQERCNEKVHLVMRQSEAKVTQLQKIINTHQESKKLDFTGTARGITPLHSRNGRV